MTGDNGKFDELKEPIIPRQRGESKEAFERRRNEECWHKIDLLLDYYKVPRDDPDAGWKLAFMLAADKFTGFRMKKPTGKTRDPKITVRDIILLAGVEMAKQKDPSATVRPIIRALAKHNDWPTNEAHLETLRVRYHSIKKGIEEHGNGRNFRYVAEMLVQMRPRLEERLRFLEKSPPA